jgi:prefoldin subunit 5
VADIDMAKLNQNCKRLGVSAKAFAEQVDALTASMNRMGATMHDIQDTAASARVLNAMGFPTLARLYETPSHD